MKRTVATYLKIILSVLLVLTSTSLCGYRLLKIQVVDSASYATRAASTYTYTQSISATRGEIVDAQGNPIIENKVGYNVIIEPDKFPDDLEKANAILLSIADLLEQHNIDIQTSLPITETAPYAFTDTEADTISKLKELLNLNVYATADNCIDKLLDDYKIADTYTQKQQRTIAGLRYEMLLRGFSLSNRFIIAEDVPIEVVTEIKENSIRLPGINIVEEATRSIAQADIIPHEIGTVGPIYAEEYAELAQKGYDLDDTVGKNGIEQAMESELRGTDGEKTITVQNGSVLSSEVSKPAQSGHTVQLTVNSDFQRDLQNILTGFIQNFDSIRDAKTEEEGLGKVTSGSIVVLDAKTGAVLGMATAPTYDLLTYKDNYESLTKDENSPLLNRATSGLYRPGSTFKTITATAGLCEGIVDANSTYFCGQTYLFHDHTYSCTGSHGNIGIVRALEVSCNIYFYHLSEALTIDRITDYATQYGLGQHTGLETGDAAGHLSDQEIFAELGQEWTVGQVLQTAIGQGEWAVTPLQMAVVANTLANDGVRYQPYLVDSIWDYNQETMIRKTEPTVAATIKNNNSSYFDTIQQGMIAASANMPGQYSLSDLGYSVAIKTGTPQAGGGRVQDSFFIGYAPADDPQIAFAGVVEGAEYSKYMIRSILKAYEDRFVHPADPATTTTAAASAAGTTTATTASANE